MPSVLWTQEELDFLVNNLDKKPAEAYRHYCQLFRNKGIVRSYDSVQKKMRKLELVSHEDTEVEEEDQSVPVLSAPLASSTKSTRRKHYEEEVRAFIEGLADVADGKKFDKPLYVQSQGSSVCVLLSDTHFGKHTKHFDMDEAEKRILSIAEKLDEVMPEDCDEVVLILAGDMIEGEDIYQTQAHHIQDTAIQQCKKAVESFWKLAVEVRNRHGVKVRLVTCPGNHGRVSKTAAEETNWDNMIYLMLGMIAKHQDDKGIVVEVNFDSFYNFPVKDKVGLIYHHGTKHTGTPAMQVKLAGWMYQKDWDFLCHGHWHQWEVGTQFGKPVIKNGSLPGEDDLSERMGVFDPPRQAWFVVRSNEPIQHFGFFQWENT